MSPCTCSDALLHEDLITPLHHDGAPDEYVLTLPGQAPRTATLHEASEAIAQHRPVTALNEADQAPDGPRGVDRRRLLAGAGFGALLAPSAGVRYAFAADAATGSAGREGSSELLVCIFLRGGMDSLSLLPPDDPAYRAARPGIAVPIETSLDLGHPSMRLNPNAGPLLPMWNEGDLAFVVGAGRPAATRSHFDEMVAVEGAGAPANVRSGWLGRHLATSSSVQGTFRAISWGTQSILSLATTFSTLTMSSIDAFNLGVQPSEYRPDVLRLIDSMYRQNGGPAASAAEVVLDTVGQLGSVPPLSPENGAIYPVTPFGQGLADTARLFRAGKGLEVACVDIPNWDMHLGLGTTDPTGWFSRNIADFAGGLAAFRTDLGALWSQVTVVAMSEFGRRVAQNGTLGCDHGTGGAVVVAGGNVNGAIYGSIPSLEPANLYEGDIPTTTDYRRPLAEIVAKRLNNAANLATVFPGFTRNDLGIVN
ncbi:MAG: DUF1501 domain-containing protein [Tetrasphaera sp.]